jgi:hypothetical protein
MSEGAPQPKARPIFLSYRRTDSAAETGRLYSALRDRFGPKSVFMDSASTAWGESWPEVVESAVAGADFVVAVIGPGWLVAQDEWGFRRIDQPDDWVRRELEFALEERKAVLPLLVGEMRMPPPDKLPAELSELSTKQALYVREETWEADVEGLLQSLAERVVAVETAAPREDTIEEEFRSVSSRFYSGDLKDRNAAAGEIAALGSLLDLNAVLEFADSSTATAGERVGAAIALAAHLRTSETLREDPRVQSALRALLNDTRERVRYRAAKVLKDFPAIASAYKQDLTWLTRPDENWQVREMAEAALRRAGLS